jgi:hypothetical protein
MDEKKKKKWYLRWWAFVLYFIIIIILINASSGNKNPQPPQSESNNTEQETLIKISAVKLSEEYDANSVSADAKYKGKRVEISGTIKDIGKDILNTPYVMLDGSRNVFFGVQCMFPRTDEPKLVNLSKGQSITLTGKVSGEIIGNVILDDCDFK